uniref:Uncharacterized protein n=1 Tax=Globodera rostochiensis TaxID=31243 RepID=A0A914I923_GLORO
MNGVNPAQPVWRCILELISNGISAGTRTSSSHHPMLLPMLLLSPPPAPPRMSAEIQFAKKEFMRGEGRTQIGTMKAVSGGMLMILPAPRNIVTGPIFPYDIGTQNFNQQCGIK